MISNVKSKCFFETKIDIMKKMNQNINILDDLYYHILEINFNGNFNKKYIIYFNQLTNTFEIDNIQNKYDEINNAFKDKLYYIDLGVQSLGEEFYFYHINQVNKFIEKFYKILINNKKTDRQNTYYDISLMYKIATKTITTSKIVSIYEKIDPILKKELRKNSSFNDIYKEIDDYCNKYGPQTIVIKKFEKILDIDDDTLYKKFYILPFDMDLTKIFRSKNGINVAEQINNKLIMLNKNNKQIFISKRMIKENIFKNNIDIYRKKHNEIMDTLLKVCIFENN